MEDYEICYCNNLKRSEIVNAIKEKGLKTVEEVGTETGAGTVCIACVEDLEDFLKELSQ